MRNVSWNDWRLPVMMDLGAPGCDWSYGGTDCGYNVNTANNELAFLFFDELGNKSYYDTSGSSAIGDWFPISAGPFKNIQAGVYWFGTEYSPNANEVWLFSMRDGYQGFNLKGHQRRYAWAVRDGDVAAAAIPEPDTYALMLVGLGLIGFMASRRKQVKA